MIFLIQSRYIRHPVALEIGIHNSDYEEPSGSFDDTIKFRAGALKEAASELDSIHLGGINISELARTGLTDMLRRTMTDEDKITLCEHYNAGEISEEATRLLLGDDFAMLEEFAAVAEDDTSRYLA